MKSASLEDKTQTTDVATPLLREEGADIPAPFHTDDDAATPLVSIIIPIYNEESILEDSVTHLMAEM